MNDQRAALEKILDKAETVDQVTLLETKHLLRDRLPAVLSELKLPTTDHAQEALRDYQDKESHLHRLSAPVHKIDALKSDLWRAVSVPQTASELLSAVRARIGEYGYSRPSAGPVRNGRGENPHDRAQRHGRGRGDAQWQLVTASPPGGAPPRRIVRRIPSSRASPQPPA